MTEFIKKFWENQGKIHASSHKASWGDLWAIELEISTLSKYIKPHDIVLDAGCGNGFSVFKQQALYPDATFYGIDYAESLIVAANDELQKKTNAKNIKFLNGNINDIKFEDRFFDLVYTTRVLINLVTWEDQKQAIEQCLRVVKPGGRLILSEGFWEPLCRLNAIRFLFNLPPLAEHDFNRYLKKEKLESYLREKNLAYKVEDFSSVYYLGSRVLQEVLLDELPPYGDYSSSVNKAFFELENKFSGGDIGIQQAYIITKR